MPGETLSGAGNNSSLVILKKLLMIKDECCYCSLDPKEYEVRIRRGWKKKRGWGRIGY